MTIPTIITPMNFSLVRDAICQLIANERDAQIALAKTGDADENWIDQNIHFTIYPKRFRLPDIANMPCVFVYFNEMTFPGDMQDIYENYALANLQIDYYAVGKSEKRTNGKSVTADENAEDRLNYLTAQIYKILCNESNVTKGTNGLVGHTKLKKWERIITPDGDSTAGTVLGASFSIELGFSEPTYYTKTQEILEFYTTLEIKDEYIDPLVRIILS